LSTPFGISFDAGGKLWVANNLRDVVQFMPVNGATALQTISGNVPHDAAVDPSGTLWVSYDNVNFVNAYDVATGLATGVTISPGSLGSHYIAFDGGGNMWLTGNSSVAAQYASPLSNSSSPVATITNGLSNSHGLAFDPAGNLYIGNIGNNTVTAYVPANGAAPFATINVPGQPFALKVTP
jgi:streptogramin lyase